MSWDARTPDRQKDSAVDFDTSGATTPAVSPAALGQSHEIGSWPQQRKHAADYATPYAQRLGAVADRLANGARRQATLERSQSQEAGWLGRGISALFGGSPPQPERWDQVVHLNDTVHEHLQAGDEGAARDALQEMSRLSMVFAQEDGDRASTVDRRAGVAQEVAEVAEVGSMMAMGALGGPAVGGALAAGTTALGHAAANAATGAETQPRDVASHALRNGSMATATGLGGGGGRDRRGGAASRRVGRRSSRVRRALEQAPP